MLVKDQYKNETLSKDETLERNLINQLQEKISWIKIKI
jgi:hypothetical protein